MSARGPGTPLRLLPWLVLLAAIGCAGPRPRVDSLEPINRAAHGLDDLGPNQVSAALEAGADRVLPDPVRAASGRFFQNLATPRILTSNLLQARPGAAATDLARFGVNTTVGLGGLLDVASPLGLARHDEDMGQVLCRWGIPFGPYVYFPVLGPSSASEATTVTLDLILAPADLLLSPLAIEASRPRQLRAIREAHEREALGMDPYAYERIAYRRDRLRQVRDEPAFVPPSAEELADPAAYGTCGYAREPLRQAASS